MGLELTKDSYEAAKEIYFNITENFYDIENNPSEAEPEILEMVLGEISKMNKVINKIDLSHFDDAFPKNAETLRGNVEGFKEASFFIERAISTMMLFDEVNPILPQYLKNVEWKSIGDTIGEAAIALSGYLTAEDNFKNYRTIIKNIIKGTISAKSFDTLFNAISPRLPKPKRAAIERRNENPPEMWAEKDKSKWDEMRRQRKEEAKKSPEWDEKEAEFDEFKESFISLENYKQLYDL